LRFIFVSEFNLEELSLENIAELSQQRGDLSALKAALVAQVEDVGAVPTREVWNDVLAVRAKEVMKEWGERASVRSLLKGVNLKEWRGDVSTFAKNIAPGIAAGTVTAAIVGALPGLAVLAVFGVVSLMASWRQSQRPYRFLSQMTQKGALSQHLLEASPA
jgi:hypothetical protein